MNKKEIIELTAREAGVSQKVANQIVNSYLSAVRSALSQGEEVSLYRIGHFTYKYVPERPYDINGHSGVVPEHYRLAFRTSDPLRKEVMSIPVTYFTEGEEIFEDE